MLFLAKRIRVDTQIPGDILLIEAGHGHLFDVFEDLLSGYPLLAHATNRCGI